MQAPENNQSEYQSLVENSTNWLWRMDLDGRYTFSNQRIESILGYTVEELLRLTLEELIHPEDMADVAKRLQASIADKHGWQHWVLRFRHKDRSYRSLISNGSPVLDATGALRGFRGVNRDISFGVLLGNALSDLVASVADAPIEDVLRRFTTYFNIDMMEMWWFDETREFVTRSNGWIRHGLPPRTTTSYRLSDMQWFSSQILAGHVVRVTDHMQLPPEAAAEKEMLLAQGQSASLSVPLVVGNQREVLGYGTAVMCGGSREWTDGEVDYLQRAFTVVASAETRVRAYQDLQAQADFQALLSDISKKLLAASINDTGLDDAQSRIGAHFKIDLLEIWWFDDARESVTRSWLWKRDDGLTEGPSNYRIPDLPWIAPQLLAGEVLRIPDFTQLPPEATIETTLMKNLGITALLAVPLTVGDAKDLVGCGVAVVYGQTREWTDQEVDNLQLAFNVIATVEARMKTERDNQARVDFQVLLTDISKKLLETSVDQEILDDSLERLATHFNLDLMDCWWFDETREFISRNHRSRDSLESEAPTYRLADLPWYSSLALAGQVVRIPDTTQLPPEATRERELMEGLGAAAILTVPLTVGDAGDQVGCGGAVVYGQPREWTDQEVDDLQLAFNIIANAEARMKTERDRRARADFQAFLTEISKNFLTASIDDTALEDALSRMATYFIVDAIEGWWFDDPNVSVSRRIKWFRGGVDPGSSFVKTSNLPWVIPQILAGQVVQITDRTQLPPEAAAERTLMEEQGFTASLLVPLKADSGSDPVGCGIVSMYGQTRKWTDQELDNLRLTFNVISASEARMKTERDSKARADFQILLTNISKSLLEASTDETMIEDVLRQLADYFDLDIMACWWFDEAGETARRSSLWRRDGFALRQSSLTLAEVPWLGPQILAGQVVRVSDLNDLPAEAAAEREIIQQHNETALAMIPLTAGSDKKLVGAGAALSQSGPHEWTDQEIDDLQLAFNIIATAEARMQATQSLQARADFQAFLARISTDLLEANIDALSQSVADKLALVGRDYRLDRIALWWFEKEDTMLRRSHGWAREGSPVPKQDLIVDESVPWIFSRMREGKVVSVENLEDIPPEHSRDRAFFQGRGGKSFLAVPLIVDDRLLGTAVFTTVEQCRAWPDETVLELRLIAEILSGAHARWIVMQKLSKRERDLTRSEQLARVGNYSFFPKAVVEEQWPPSGETVFSKELSAMLGVEPGEASFEIYLSRVHDDDREGFIESLRHALEEDPDYLFHYRLVRPDGTQLHIEDRGEIDRDTRDQPVRLFGSIKDVTKQVLREHELKETITMVEELKEHLHEENIYLREEVRVAHGFHQIIGESPKLRQALNAVEKVAPTDVTVLILGETGTGKELIANAVHELSDRSDQPLVSVNCAALSVSLIESELFGHERGAFTGAQSLRKGRFELANKGTLFLDEIGELPLELQAKLLRVLQTGSFERLGSSETMQVDVRIIVATNRDLEKAVDAGEFRADLYYRINNFPILLPPLHERQDDIPLLTEYLVRKNAKHLGKEIESISARMINYLQHREWPGNVRELESFIERALITTTGPVLDYTEVVEQASETLPEITGTKPEGQALSAAERKHILEVLEETNWVISGKRGAAPRLGVPPSTLRSKMKRLGIRR